MIIEEIGSGRDPASLTVGLVVASFNQAITDRLYQGAIKSLEELGVGKVRVLRVAGA
ncbi:MAG: 6,7-dimethyl-8-ribityllumazine synthase, partial [Acidimicrobiia bacterium]